MERELATEEMGEDLRRGSGVMDDLKDLKEELNESVGGKKSR